MAQQRVKPTSVRPKRSERLYPLRRAAGNRFVDITHHDIQLPDGKVKTHTDFGLGDSVTVLVIAPNVETGRFGVVVFEELKFAVMGLMPTTVSGYLDGADKGSPLAAARRKLQVELGVDADELEHVEWIDFNQTEGTRAYPQNIQGRQFGYALFVPSFPAVPEKKQAWVADLCPRGVDDLAVREVTDAFGSLRLYAREAMIWLGQQGLIDWFGNPTPAGKALFA